MLLVVCTAACTIIVVAICLCGFVPLIVTQLVSSCLLTCFWAAPTPLVFVRCKALAEYVIGGLYRCLYHHICCHAFVRLRRHSPLSAAKRWLNKHAFVRLRRCSPLPAAMHYVNMCLWFVPLLASSHLLLRFCANPTHSFLSAAKH